MRDYKNILFNYKRNKKRIEQIREDYTGIGAVQYDGDKIQAGGENKPLENSIVQLLSDKEYNTLTKEVNVVELILERLTYREKIVITEYFFNKQTVKWIERTQPISYRTIYRDIRCILELVKEEFDNL